MEDNALINAILEDDIEQLENLLRSGSPPDRFNSVGFAAIHCAAETGNAKAVDLLLSFGANPNLLDGNEMTPLAYSAADGSSTIALHLLRHGAGVNLAANAYTPLAWAAQEGHEDVIRLLAEYGADMNASSKFGITPLTNAAGEGDLRIVRLLLERGAAINHVHNQWTALHNACSYKQHRIARELVARGANVNLKDEMGRTPLFFSAMKGDYETARLLIENGAEKKIRDKERKYPADHADDSNQKLLSLLEM